MSYRVMQGHKNTKARILFSIWRHRFTWAIIIRNMSRADALRASVSQGGGGGKLEYFCLHLTPTSVHNLHNFLGMYPNFTILARSNMLLNMRKSTGN